MNHWGKGGRGEGGKGEGGRGEGGVKSESMDGQGRAILALELVPKNLIFS